MMLLLGLLVQPGQEVSGLILEGSFWITLLMGRTWNQ